MHFHKNFQATLVFFRLEEFHAMCLNEKNCRQSNNLAFHSILKSKKTFNFLDLWRMFPTFRPSVFCDQSIRYFLDFKECNVSVTCYLASLLLFAWVRCYFISYVLWPAVLSLAKKESWRILLHLKVFKYPKKEQENC